MSDYIISNGELHNVDELQHYGVLGMKWGIRRGKYAKTFKKASKKANRIIKAQRRAESKLKKADATMMRRRTYKNPKKLHKAMRDQAKWRSEVMRLENKGRKWQKKMADAFEGVKISDMDSKALFYGQDYLHMLIADDQYVTKE